MLKNYFKPETRSFKVIELLNAGKTRDEVAKTMKYASKNAVAQVVSRWKLKERDALAKALLTKSNESLNGKKELKPNVETSTSMEGEKKIPLSPGGAEIIQRLPVPPGIDDPGGVTIQIEGFAPGRQVFLTPKNILMFQWFLAKHPKWEGDLSDFINQAIEAFFNSINWKIKMVQEEMFV